jgi:hypothetical protein
MENLKLYTHNDSPPKKLGTDHALSGIDTLRIINANLKTHYRRTEADEQPGPRGRKKRKKATHKRKSGKRAKRRRAASPESSQQSSSEGSRSSDDSS